MSFRLYLSALIALVAVWIYYIVLCAQPGNLQTYNSFFGALLCTCGIYCWLLLLSKGTIPAGAVRVDAKGMLKVVYKRKSISFVSYRLIIFPHTIMHSTPMIVRPITPNPKVREISYLVAVKTAGTVESLLAGLRRIWSGEETMQENVNRFVRQQCYEFNEQHSIELGALYNPLDANQQATFRGLLYDFLTPRLAEANLTLAEASFSC